MKVAAVILNYNDAEGTIEAVKRIEDFECLDTIIVVDNASTDDSALRIKSYLRGLNRELMEDEEEDDNKACHRYMLVSAEKNGGYGFGNNLGVKYAYEIAGAELVLIANPDAAFSEKLILDMLECFAKEDEAAVVGALMAKRPERVSYEDCKRSAWRLRGLYGELLSTGPLTRRIFGAHLNYDASHFIGHSYVEVDAVHGSLLMVDADRFMACGGYDEEIFLYCEENVLAAKMKENGCKTFLLLNGSYRHEGSGSISKNGLSAVKRQRLRQQSEQYYYKNYLHAGSFTMFFARLFHAVTLLETWVAEKLRMF